MKAPKKAGKDDEDNNEDDDNKQKEDFESEGPALKYAKRLYTKIQGQLDCVEEFKINYNLFQHGVEGFLGGHSQTQLPRMLDLPYLSPKHRRLRQTCMSKMTTAIKTLIQAWGGGGPKCPPPAPMP